MWITLDFEVVVILSGYRNLVHPATDQSLWMTIWMACSPVSLVLRLSLLLNGSVV